MHQHGAVFSESTYFSKIIFYALLIPLHVFSPLHVLQPTHNESAFSLLLPEHAPPHPPLAIHIELVPAVTQKTPALAHLRRVVGQRSDVQPWQQMVVVNEQQRRFLLFLHSPKSIVQYGTDVVDAEANLVDQHIVALPRYRPIRLGCHSNLQSVRSRPQNAVHGTNAASVLSQRYETLHQRIHAIDDRSCLVRCILRWKALGNAILNGLLANLLCPKYN